MRKPRLERPRPRRPLISSWPGREINRNTVILSRARQHSTTGYENTTFSWGRQLAKAPHQGAPRPSVAFGAMHASLFSTHRASIPVCVASRPPPPAEGPPSVSSLEVPNVSSTSTLRVATGSTPTRRDLLAGTVGLFAGSSLFPTPALAADSLSQRLERRDLNKPVFNKARPGPQQYPDWMEGTWSATADFQGYSFPSKTMNPKLLVKEPTVPGFQKLSVVYIPDIGSTQVRYEMPVWA